MVLLKPVVGAPEPVFGEGFVSDNVLPVTAASSGSSGTPAGGLRARSPNSAALIGLAGIASASAAAPAAFRAGRSPGSTCGGFRDGPLTVARDDDLAGSEVFERGAGFAGRLRVAISMPRNAR